MDIHALWNSEWVQNNLPVLQTWAWNLLKIALIYILLKVGVRILTRFIKRTLRLRVNLDERRRETLVSVATNVLRYAFYFVFVLTILPIFGVNIGALLAGAGVAGIAIAFAAQNLIKDFFSGFFILFEDHYGVGDYVVINNTWGQVVSVGLRTTTIKVWTGEVVVIPNGEIKQVTNYSKENSLAVIDVKVGYSSDVDRVMEIVERVMQELAEEEENIVGESKVLGVESLNDWNYTVRAIAECKPYTHWGVQRKARQRLRSTFEKEGIDVPIQKITLLHDQNLMPSFTPEEPVPEKTKT